MAVSPSHAARRGWRPWQAVIAFCAAYLGVVFALNGADASVFVMPGTCFSSCDYDAARGCPPGTEEGYDGQFAYYIARDPAHAAACLDVPAYRFQRILLPALGYLFSFGVDALIPVAFVLVNLAALALSTAALEDLLIQQRVSRWYALVYGLFYGVVVGVRVSTPEPLAYGLLIGAIWLSVRQPECQGLRMLTLLGAALAKETVLISVAGFVLYDVLARRWRAAALTALGVGLPFAAWQLFLAAWLGTAGIGSGGKGTTPFEIIPYNGVWRLATDTGDLVVFLVLGALVIPLAVVPSLWGIWASARTLWQRREAHLYTCLVLLNALALAAVPFSTYREYLGIARFLPGLVLTHILFTARYYPRRPLIYSTLWLVSLLFVVSG